VRVCLAGRAANVGFAVAAGADCASCISCAVSLGFTATVLVVRFGCAADFADLVARLGSGSTVSALFDRVARFVIGSASSCASCGFCDIASSSSSSFPGFLERVTLVRVVGCDVFAAVAAVAAVARLTGFFRSARLSF
jgi:hypothetical protein